MSIDNSQIETLERFLMKGKISEPISITKSEVRDYSSKYLRFAESLIKIDSEFKNLIPALNQEERTYLENNIIEFGVREPLVVWKDYNILLDGHNRYEICVKNGIDYELIEIELPTREDARLWIMRNQLGKRNLTSEFLSYFRGKLHQACELPTLAYRQSVGFWDPRRTSVNLLRGTISFRFCNLPTTPIYSRVKLSRNVTVPTRLQNRT